MIIGKTMCKQYGLLSHSAKKGLNWTSTRQELSFASNGTVLGQHPWVIIKDL